MTENFVRDGMVGDEVWHPCHGNGVIKHISSDEDIVYPVSVLFTLTLRHRLVRKEVSFRPSGRQYSANACPALCWGHRIAQQINQGKPPRGYENDG